MDGSREVAMVTCVVLEPDRVEIERRCQVENMRIVTLQQVRDDHLRSDTHTHTHIKSDSETMTGVFVLVYCTSGRFPLG